MAERGGGDHAGPQAGERAGSGAGHDGGQVARGRTAFGEDGLDLRGEQLAVRPAVHGDPLGKDGDQRIPAARQLGVLDADERGRHRGRRGVHHHHQHGANSTDRPVTHVRGRVRDPLTDSQRAEPSIGRHLGGMRQESR
ncbi:hypothetical protein GCM10027610_111560 [Dactylosporangium cerinum]